MHKYFAQREFPYLSDYDTFTQFIGTYFLLARISSSATNILLNKESITFYNPDLVQRSISYEDYAKLWREISSHGLPKIGILNIDMNRFLWAQPLW